MMITIVIMKITMPVTITMQIFFHGLPKRKRGTRVAGAVAEGVLNPANRVAIRCRD